MDLFDYMRENTIKQESPLASRLRPQTLDEVVGQQHIIGKDKLLYRAIQADKLSSIIFYGPPGTGKTTPVSYTHLDVYKRQAGNRLGVVYILETVLHRLVTEAGNQGR